MLAVPSERSLTLTFRLELPLEKETWPWPWLLLLLELRLLSPPHSFNPGLFENLRGIGLDGARAPRDPGAAPAEALVADEEQREPARSSKFLAPSTPYSTIVSRATWMYLNAQVTTTRSSLVRQSVGTRLCGRGAHAYGGGVQQWRSCSAFM